MTPIPVNLAVEDELSEIVLRVLLKHTAKDHVVGAAHRRGGFGYLKRTISGWNAAAPSVPIIVLTDLDNHPCPSDLIQTWLAAPQHPNLVFRVAVRQVESWLLADYDGISKFLGVLAADVPRNTDRLPNAKDALVDLARKSRRRDIRDQIVPKPRSTAKQGRSYNTCLGSFVLEQWNPGAASRRSPSLARTAGRLSEFRPVWGSDWE